MTLAPPVAARLAARADAPAPALSPREIEMLGLLAEGRSNRDLGSPSVPERGDGQVPSEPHLGQARRGQLGVDSRAGAVAHALGSGPTRSTLALARGDDT